MQNIKQTKNISLWKVLGVIYNITITAFWLWFIISWVEVCATNLPNNPAIPSTWNFFNVLFEIF